LIFEAEQASQEERSLRGAGGLLLDLEDIGWGADAIMVITVVFKNW
jgi:hypothetical protein